LSASLDMQPCYPFLGVLQPKNLCKTTNQYFGSVPRMRECDPKEFGDRVRARRVELGFSQGRLAKASGQSQSNIGWIETGQSKDPRKQVVALAEALWTSQEYLLWGTGIKETGRPLMSGDEVQEAYNSFSLDDRAAVTQAFSKLVEAMAKKRKSR
jgi:transcriptional regulator with XRE-family HTH domain